MMIKVITGRYHDILDSIKEYGLEVPLGACIDDGSSKGAHHCHQSYCICGSHESPWSR